MSRRVRKTIPVEDIRKRANAYFASPKHSQQDKKVIHAFVGSILHATGNYHGFNYLHWSDVGFKQWMADGQPEDKTPYIGPTEDIYLH